jgi:hypothetical protein
MRLAEGPAMTLCQLGCHRGSRAATDYGQHVAIELAALLAEKGVATVSGGAYGTLS